MTHTLLTQRIHSVSLLLNNHLNILCTQLRAVIYNTIQKSPLEEHHFKTRQNNSNVCQFCPGLDQWRNVVKITTINV